MSGDDRSVDEETLISVSSSHDAVITPSSGTFITADMQRALKSELLKVEVEFLSVSKC